MYQGQYFDKEIDLAYNRFRYYDPTDGRYISVGPIGLDSGEPNFYAYVNDSNTFIDPFGLIADPYGGYFSRKALRTSINESKRPSKGSMHATKHIQASTMDDALNRSIKGVGGKPEASYFPEIAKNNFNNFEKSAAV